MRYTFEDFQKIAEKLRAADGCPWDRAQTHESLKGCMIDELTEAIAAVNVLKTAGDADNLCEELGDLLFLVLLQSQIAREEGLFIIDDVIQNAAEKIVRRHPHVFPDENGVKRPADWKGIKKKEKEGKDPEILALIKEEEKKAAGEICSYLEKMK